MTVTQLIRKLEALKAKHGNLKVVVNKEELDDGNGCWTVCHISTVVAQYVTLSDDDGGVAYTKDGLERGTTQIVIGNGPLTKTG